jgi:hypothetical protein
MESTKSRSLSLFFFFFEAILDCDLLMDDGMRMEECMRESNHASKTQNPAPPITNQQTGIQFWARGGDEHYILVTNHES